MFVHDVDQRAGVVDRRLLQHAVAEVEDVAGAAGGLVEDVDRRGGGVRLCRPSRAIGSRLPWIARSWPIICQASSSRTRQSTPITAAPASASSGKSCGLPVAKLITGTPGVMPRDDLLDVRQHELAIVVGAEAADPAVEELHRLGTGGDLGVEIDE